MACWFVLILIKDMLINFRQKGGARHRDTETDRDMRERNVDQFSPVCTLTGLKPSYTPWLGIKPTTFWCMGCCSTHTPGWHAYFYAQLLLVQVCNLWPILFFFDNSQSFEILYFIHKIGTHVNRNTFKYKNTIYFPKSYLAFTFKIVII